MFEKTHDRFLLYPYYVLLYCCYVHIGNEFHYIAAIPHVIGNTFHYIAAIPYVIGNAFYYIAAIPFVIGNAFRYIAAILYFINNTFYYITITFYHIIITYFNTFYIHDSILHNKRYFQLSIAIPDRSFRISYNNA